MNKKDYKNPDKHIFYCDKEDWFEVVDGEKYWHEIGKIKKFWEEVRKEKMAEEDFDFSEFVFPEFAGDNFWLKDKERAFSGDVNFYRSKFTGKASFNNTKFTGKTSFGEVLFSGYADFAAAQFSEYTIFDKAQFFGEANFTIAQFFREARFNYTEFINESYWVNTFLIEQGKVSFNSTYFPEDHRTWFQEWSIEYQLLFSGITFPDYVRFQDFYFENVLFERCNLAKVEFSNCHFKKLNGRIVLGNDNNSEYVDLSSTYRQLKKNLMDARDWTNAGDAYRSEMVMTRKLLWQQVKSWEFGKIPNLIIMWFYQVLSGYQQSIGRPLMLLLGLLIICPIILYYSDQCNQGWQVAIKTSLIAAFPFAGKIEIGQYDDSFFFLLFFERLFSLILITFFILATRARLRQ